MLPKCLKDINVPIVILDGKALKWVREQKYLGVFISNNTSVNQRRMESTYCRRNISICKFRKCTDEVKVQLSKSFCTNVYCGSFWSTYILNLLMIGLM